jgi:HK97 family phage major capsid protein
MPGRREVSVNEKDLERKIEEGFDAVADAMREHIDGRLEKTDQWISRVEAKVNTARSHGPGRDGLLSAIPSEYKKQIDMAERSGFKDPVNQVALGAWWSLQFKGKLAMRQNLGKPPGEFFEQADKLERGWGFDPVLKGAIGEVAGGGANVIATPVEAELMRLLRDNSIVRGLATRIVMSSLTHQVPVENANVTAYIVPETTVITDSMATTAFAQRPLTAKVIAGLATVSNQLLQDNIIGLQQYLFNAISEHIGIIEDQGALDGGTPSVQNFSGIAVASGVNSFTINGTGVSGGSVPTYAELIKIVYMAQQSATRAGAGFFMTPGAFKNIISLVDTAGMPIFSFANVPGAIPNFIGGYPVYLVSSLSTAWSTFTSSSNIYFGPPAKILYGDIAGMSFDIDPYSLLDRVQTRVRVLKRTGILVPVGSHFSIAKGVDFD